MLEIDQYQPVEITLNVKSDSRLSVINACLDNELIEACQVALINKNIYKVKIEVQPHNIKKFMKKVKKLLKDK